MIFKFHASQVREQIVHAQQARLRQAGVTDRGLLAPSLILKRTGSRVFLISNGVPRSDHSADALGFGAADPSEPVTPSEDATSAARAAGATLDADEDIGPADFSEGIAVTAFENALGDPYVSVLVRRTYVNILGRRRSQPVPVSSPATYRHGMHLTAQSAEVAAMPRPPQKRH